VKNLPADERVHILAEDGGENRNPRRIAALSQALAK